MRRPLNGPLHRVDYGRRTRASLAEVPISLTDRSGRIDPRGRFRAFFLPFHVWRHMDGSHILLTVVGILAALSAVTSVGAMFALGRGKAYDK
ncbi:hypothetical protein GCM10010910_00660 [Microbacterium nanhaiense]|uniref:Uncharacterized protein n=1 Tax=Microbacterium nanhaiense TaxID=1301026 RepID=A0ABQ2MZM3_9MICO|nr:hypothetical protein GCM10010910_00660 [Microbacterium nanhaiense]